ncbi:MAG: nuclear transport factor 2 family protein, partial [Myxococcota bacterium]
TLFRSGGGLSEAEDRLAIVALLDRYTEALDTRRWELLDEVFDPDVVFDFGPDWQTRGRGAAVERIRAALDACGPTQHLQGNHRIEIEGDRARSRVYVRAFHAAADPAERAAGRFYEMAGEYRDELRRGSDGWRSLRRVGRMRFEVGDREVLAPKH